MSFDSSTPTSEPWKVDFGIGLAAATEAILASPRAICTLPNLVLASEKYPSPKFSLPTSNTTPSEPNTALVTLIRGTATNAGWLSGWQVLFLACPNIIHPTLLDDIIRGVSIYQSLRVTNSPRKLISKLQFTVVSTPQIGNLNEIGPKSLGGHTWQDNPLYLSSVKKWNIPSSFPLGPCPLFFWVGGTKKVFKVIRDPVKAGDLFAAQLLGTVDYDFDKEGSAMATGIRNAVERTAQLALEPVTRPFCLSLLLRRICSGLRQKRPLSELKIREAWKVVKGENETIPATAWTALLTMDQQLFNRSIQDNWVSEALGPFLIGPSQTSPEDFALAAYVDCAALCTFSFQPETIFGNSKRNMFITVLFANLHDFLYDMGCSSRISSTGYAYSSGAFEHDLPQAWVLGWIDKLAEVVLERGERREAEGGLWHECVDGLLCLEHLQRQWSEDEMARGILERAKEGMVLVQEDWDVELGTSWREVLDLGSKEKLVPRKSLTRDYQLGDPVKALDYHGVIAPEGLCDKCSASFYKAFTNPSDTIQAIPGLPATVISSEPVALAASIRRASLWATTTECCDNCSCIIGFWANNFSDRVVIAIMQTEQKVSVKEWILQCYAVGCVAFSPLRVMSVLAGFDVSVDVGFQKGVMGDRDVVDC